MNVLLKDRNDEYTQPETPSGFVQAKLEDINLSLWNSSILWQINEESSQSVDGPLFIYGNPSEVELTRFRSIMKLPIDDGDLWLGQTIEDE